MTTSRAARRGQADGTAEASRNRLDRSPLELSEPTVKKSADDFDWGDERSVIITDRVQAAIAVYPNEAGDLVIRQQAHYLVDREDLVIVIGAEHIQAFIEQVHIIAGIPTTSSRRPPVANVGLREIHQASGLDRSQHSVPASAQAAGYAGPINIAIITSRRDRRRAQAQTATTRPRTQAIENAGRHTPAAAHRRRPGNTTRLSYVSALTCGRSPKAQGPNPPGQ